MVTNKRQHARPVYISGFEDDAKAHVLKPISLISGDSKTEKYDEGWLQRLIFEHPQILPVAEIEPAFFPLYPVCMELATAAGFLDNLYVSENGGLTLVECKLWRNPQARREVIGQVLDYAKELSQWSYEDLDQAIGSNTGSKNALFEIISSENEDLDEAPFVDAVSKNLKKGRFLLLIVGDGIREGVENIVNFLQAHAGLDFTFGLVELGLFKFPDNEEILVQPRTIAQTYSIERAVISVSSEGIVITPPADQKVTHKQAGKRTTISEEQFYENIEAALPGISSKLREFVEKLDGLEISPSFGVSSLNLYWSPESNWKMNFGSIGKNGRLDTDVSNWTPDKLGRVDIGHTYQERLAKLVPGATVKIFPKRTRKIETRKVFYEGREILISTLLAHQENWIELIERTQNEIIDAIS